MADRDAMTDVNRTHHQCSPAKHEVVADDRQSRACADITLAARPAADAAMAFNRAVPPNGSDEASRQRELDNQASADVADGRDVASREQEIQMPERAADEAISTRMKIEAEAMQQHALIRRQQPQPPPIGLCSEVCLQPGTIGAK